ncbi:MAG: hypothetical protein GOV00_03450 [Candidatus Altiarchaeota archaeon]|nr:hypothetical protein [Candidatus Altiarchaeota archaeon]
MRPLFMLLLVGAAIMIIFVPMIPPSSGTQTVEIYETPGGVILSGKTGQMKVSLSSSEELSVYSSENPFDFLSKLVDASQISRLELLPYGSDAICNVVASGTTKGLAGKPSFCVALSIRTGIPLYVSKELLIFNSELPKSLQPLRNR